MIRQQRDLRRDQTAAAREAEARAQAERERAERAEAAVLREKAEREAQTELAREASEREQAARRRERQMRIAAAAFAVLLVMALGAVGFAVYEGHLAGARAEEAAHSYALALAAARGNVDFVDSHYKTGEIGTGVAKSLLDAASSTFGGLSSERESVDATRSRIKLFSKLAETYLAFGDLTAALEAAQTREGSPSLSPERAPTERATWRTATTRWAPRFRRGVTSRVLGRNMKQHWPLSNRSLPKIPPTRTCNKIFRTLTSISGMSSRIRATWLVRS